MKRALRIAGIVLALVLVVILALPFFINANQFRPMLEQRLSDALGRPVTIGGLQFSIFSGGASASDIAVADDPRFRKQPFLRAKTLSMGVELWPLIVSRQLNVTSLTVDQPEIALLQSPAGDWNFSSIGGKTSGASANPAPATTSRPGPAKLSVKLIRVNKGRVSLDTIGGGKSKPRVLENVYIDVRDFSPASSFPFTLAAAVAGGGSVKLSGNAGPIRPADLIETPFQASVTVSGLDLAGSGFAQPSSGVAGIVSVEGKASSDGRILNINGKLKAENLKLAKGGTPAKRPVEIDLALAHELTMQTGTVQRSTIQIGGAQASLSGTYRLNNEESPTINARLSGSKMPLTELAAILPALDVVLPAGAVIERGTLTVDVTSAGPFDKLVTSGSIDVDDARLNNFDLGSKMKAIQQLSGIQGEPRTTIQNLHASFTVAPEGTTVRDLKGVAPAVGELTGSGVIGPQHELNFQMRAVVKSTSHLLTALGQKSDIPIPFRITGTSSNPTFTPDVKGAAQETLQQYTKDPSKAIDAAKSIMDLFKKPKEQAPQK